MLFKENQHNMKGQSEAQPAFTFFFFFFNLINLLLQNIFSISYFIENYRISEGHFFYIPATCNNVKQQTTKSKFRRKIEENLSKIWKNESLFKLTLHAA